MEQGKKALVWNEKKATTTTRKAVGSNYFLELNIYYFKQIFSRPYLLPYLFKMTERFLLVLHTRWIKCDNILSDGTR